MKLTEVTSSVKETFNKLKREFDLSAGDIQSDYQYYRGYYNWLKYLQNHVTSMLSQPDPIRWNPHSWEQLDFGVFDRPEIEQLLSLVQTELRRARREFIAYKRTES